jgi:hypothetical protein
MPSLSCTVSVVSDFFVVAILTPVISAGAIHVRSIDNRSLVVQNDAWKWSAQQSTSNTNSIADIRYSSAVTEIQCMHFAEHGDI